MYRDTLDLYLAGYGITRRKIERRTNWSFGVTCRAIFSVDLPIQGRWLPPLIGRILRLSSRSYAHGARYYVFSPTY